MSNKSYVALTFLLAGANCLSAQALVPLALNANGHSFEYVARADQSGDTATLYGYVTHIAGIDDALLFAPGVSSTTPPRSEVNARLTIVTKLTFTSRYVNGTLVIASQDEAMTIYFNQFPQARDFTKADTFSSGAAVATFKNRVQTILNVQTPLSAQSPGRGIIQGSTDSVQEGASVFTLEDKRYVIGQVGHGFRLFASGEGTLTSANPFVASFLLGGYAEASSARRLFR
jgi:hypothetical protein